MRIYPFFSVRAFSNTYLFGPAGGGNAILVDPGAMDVALLELIEGHGYTVRWVLITHAHEGHCGGISTIKRIYDAEILAASPEVQGFGTTVLRHGENLDLDGMKIHCQEIPGHSGDSLCFLVDSFLFSGDVIGAGTVGPTPNAYARKLLVRGVTELLDDLDPETRILPGHGPPTTVGVEAQFNPELRQSGQDAGGHP